MRTAAMRVVEDCVEKEYNRRAEGPVSISSTPNTTSFLNSPPKSKGTLFFCCVFDFDTGTSKGKKNKRAPLGILSRDAGVPRKTS